MKRLIFMALGALTLSGCTGTRIKPPAVCDGKHRRPANIYGSTLPMLPVPLPPSQIGGHAVAASPAPDTEPASGPPAALPRDLQLGPLSVPERGTKGDAKPVPTGMTTPGSAPETSGRDVARSYLSC